MQDAMEQIAGWLRARSKPVRRYLFLTVGLGEAAGLLFIVQTALIVRIGNGVIFLHERLSSLVLVFCLLPAAIGLRALSIWASRRAAFACSGSVKHGLRRELLARVAAAGPIALAGEHAGEVANTVVDAVEALDSYYARYLPQRAIASLLPLTVLAVVFPLDWISGVTLFVTALFIPVLMILIGEDAHERNRRLWGKLSQMSARFLDTLQGIPTLKIFGAARQEARIIAAISEDYRHSTMSVMRIAFISALMLELISTVSIAIVAIASGLRMLAGHMPFAPGYFILLLAPEYFLALRNLGTYYHSRMEAVSAAEHIVRLLAPVPMVNDGVNEAARKGTTAAVTAGNRSERGTVAADSLTAPGDDTRRRRGGGVALSFRDVGFSYATDRGIVLDGVSFEVGAGEHLALVGRSGAGKSTLLAMLLGFASPTSGRLLVDGDLLSAEGRSAWLERVSWLPQRPTIFHGTLAENIALGRPDVSRKEVERAAERAHVDEFVERLPQGYETRLGERGQGLSGGQIQRVALARLFLREADLVLLDEPTAHLDAESDTLVRSSIAELAEERTLLLVTHRVRSVTAFDRVLVLSAGRIAEEGRPAALIERGGLYAQMTERLEEELE